MRKINQKGFALAMMVPLLPVLLAMGLASYAAMTFLQIEQRFSYTCRSGNLLGQTKAGKQIDALLKLNPKASKLISDERKAQAELALAISIKDVPGATKAQLKINSIHAKQEVLNIRQKAIIQQGNLALTNAQQSTSRELGLMTTKIIDYRSLFDTSARVTSSSYPKLSVSPEGTDIAPIYRTDSDIEQKQVLVHRWQYELRVNRHLQSLISGSFKFQKSCAVTVTEKGQSWVPKILRDK
ncbi:hypothetical protein B9G69_001085 [Bdellovibrio sp. SKB1291214]|uniref:hypothetical protein n=1 Tax=Bdellovibrio sp. SKB1291214 TaxID=1732569 RepID=UPI00223FBCB6|nr:hypothetical protein [Bdellovibrio sp. SKB1291214]UYL09169.1 hypothetical protein B9G69_001085 [Bdellovibrio sp. SKB1291214]